jgi:hypothetical protein
MDVKEAARAWLSFLGDDPLYPREIMTPSFNGKSSRVQYEARNPIDLVEVISRFASRSDVWVSARPTTQFQLPVHTRFWADVDADGNIDEAIRLRRLINKFSRDAFGVEPYWQFSASKGFHGHVDHAPVNATSDQYKDALKKLLREHGLDPSILDFNVIGKYRAMPRPPFTGNTNAVEFHGEFLYTIPVSYDETTEDILAVSRSPSYRPVNIPFAPHAAGLIQEVVNELPPPSVVHDKPFNDAPSKRRVEETIQFLVKVAPTVKDGHKRFLRYLVVPAYLHSCGGDDDAAREAARAFVEASGSPWAKYKPYVDTQIKAARFDHGRIMWPMRLRKFFVENPDILRANGKR